MKEVGEKHLINYPTKKNTSTNKRRVVSFANKGMALEEMINAANEFYKNHEIAYINKRPTPVKVMKTDGKYNIKDAIFLSPSTLDYVGVFRGLYLDFEAKETSSKNGFPLSNVATHQFEAIDSVIKYNGLSFVLIYFKAYEEVYLVDGTFILDFYKQKQKTIPYSLIKEKCVKVKPSYCLYTDYIRAVIETYIEKK